jgi:carboxymethylenebutenolidase
MGNRIVIEAPDGTFDAYIARPTSIAAPAVVILQELFGVNADIRATCDELAAKGFVSIAPDLFWRQEPGVDLDVTSEESWQHGLRLYTAFDRDAGVRDVMETVRTTVELKESSGKVALLGFCLGALMVFITPATRSTLPLPTMAAIRRNTSPKLTDCKRRY